MVDRELPRRVAAIDEAHPIVMNNESGRALGWELANAREQISEGLRERLEFGLSQTEAAVADAHAVFDRASVRSLPAWRVWTAGDARPLPVRRRPGWNGPAIRRST